MEEELKGKANKASVMTALKRKVNRTEQAEIEDSRNTYINH